MRSGCESVWSKPGVPAVTLCSIACVAISFDYKDYTKSGTTAFQYAIWLVTAGCLAALSALTYRTARNQTAVLFERATAWFIAGTLVSSLSECGLQAQPFSLSTYLASAFPFILFMLAFRAFSSLLSDNSYYKPLGGALFAACFLQMVWRYYYASDVAGYDTDTMRWQVLSSGRSFVLAVFLARLSLGRLDLVSVLGGVAALYVAAISITRGVLIGTAVIVFASMVVFVRRASLERSRSSRLRVLSTIVVVIVLCLATFQLVLFVRPNTFETWETRISGLQNTKDMNRGSVLGRWTQAVGMMRSVADSPWTLAIGKGFSGKYEDANDVLGTNELGGSRTGFVHVRGNDSLLPYVFFLGGMLFSPAFYLCIAIMICLAFRALGKAATLSRSSAREVFVLAASFRALEFAVGSASGYAFGDRFGGFLLGACAAFLIVGLVRDQERNGEGGYSVQSHGGSRWK